MSERSSTNGTICHILPCSIDQDINAPIAQYFHPTQLPAEAMPKSNTNAAEGDDSATNNNDNVTIMAAQFRGRGLLCAVDGPSSTADTAHDVSCEDDGTPKPSTTLSKLPSNLMGVALSPSNSNGTKSQNACSKDPPTQSLKVLETFQHMNTWSHEHDVQKVMRERHGSDKYGLNAVVGWCELAHDVHDPIPVPP